MLAELIKSRKTHIHPRRGEGRQTKEAYALKACIEDIPAHLAKFIPADGISRKELQKAGRVNHSYKREECDAAIDKMLRDKVLR